MNTFKISRFWQVLKWTFANNRQRMMKMLMVFTLILTSFFLLIINSGISHTDKADYLLRISSALGLAAGMFFTILLLAPSLTTSGIGKDRQYRLNTLMLPATNAEKFTALLINAFVVFIVTLIGAFLIADLLQYIVALIFHPDKTGFLTAEFFRTNVHFLRVRIHQEASMTGYWEGIFSITSLLWIMSVYLLGGMYFRRYAWLFVSVGFFLLFIGTGIFFSNYKPDFIIEIKLKMFLAITAGVFAVLTLLNLWFSYRLFCRLQLINHKWTNI